MFKRTKDLPKETLYEGVKTLVECEDKHVQLVQQKLYTLFSLGFQYFLFRSTKKPGAYIIRIEDNLLAEKLCKRSKDPSTRKFLQSLLIPRKFKYGKSIFYLDFFLPGSWNLTSEISPEKIKGALIVKNTSEKLMDETETTIEAEEENTRDPLPNGYFYYSLAEFVEKTILISVDKSFENNTKISFPFIKEEKKELSGVTLSEDIDV